MKKYLLNSTLILGTLFFAGQVYAAALPDKVCDTVCNRVTCGYKPVGKLCVDPENCNPDKVKNCTKAYEKAK